MMLPGMMADYDATLGLNQNMYNRDINAYNMNYGNTVNRQQQDYQMAINQYMLPYNMAGSMFGQTLPTPVVQQEGSVWGNVWPMIMMGTSSKLPWED